MTLKPLECTERVLNPFAGWLGRPIDHNNWQAKSPGGGNFSVGRLTARVFSDEDIDRAILEEAEFILLLEWPAFQEKLRLRWQDSLIRWVDRADHVGMLRCRPEGREFEPADGQKDTARLWIERGDSGVDAVDTYPPITAHRLPARPNDRNKWEPKHSRRDCSVSRDLAGERMRGVDDRFDAFAFEPIDKAVYPAKSTDPVRHRWQDGQSRTACERQCGRESLVARKEPREFRRFRRAAENENAHDHP